MHTSAQTTRSITSALAENLFNLMVQQHREFPTPCGSVSHLLPNNCKTVQLITRAWYDWNTPNTDQVTKQSHLGNFGYAYGIMFHYGETDGLEREFVDHNLSGWRMVPREFEKKYLEADFEVHIPNEFSDVSVPPVIEERLLFEEAVNTGVPENRLSVDKLKLKEK